MGGCNQSKVVPSQAAGADVPEISPRTIKEKTLFFWKFFKNRHSMTRVAPALAGYRHVAPDRTIEIGADKPPTTPVLPGSGRAEDSPSPTFSEESLAKYMTEETADGDDLFELETAYRPPTPNFCIVGAPLLDKEPETRQESKEIIRQLREAGIVARPQTRASGLTYEDLAKQELGPLKKKPPPARLQTLKQTKKIKEARGDGHLGREQTESRMQKAKDRRKNVIGKVRFQQTQHLVQRLNKTHETLAPQQKAETPATTEGQEEQEQTDMPQEVPRDLGTELPKEHRIYGRRPQGVVKRKAKIDKQFTRIILVKPMRGLEPDQSRDDN